jgi:DNA-binding NarL/FixJ family response regulator
VKEGGPEACARLVIADDHEGTRVLLRTLLSLHPEIEVVGEAENGEEAARLAVSGEADIALLDIEMPRMGGLTAAELIMSVRPQARVILHTASADETKRARARELGLTVLVKGDFDATIAAVTERLQEAKLRAGLEALVLSALAARSAEAVVVINAEQSISFYSAAAAKLLRLPLPAEPMTLAEMRLQHPLFDTESVTSPALAPERAIELRRPADARRPPARPGRLEPDPSHRRRHQGRGRTASPRRTQLPKRHRDRTRRLADPARRPLGQPDRALPTRR